MTKPTISGEEHTTMKKTQAQVAPSTKWQWIAGFSILANVGLIIALIMTMQAPTISPTNARNPREITAPQGNAQAPGGEANCTGNACTSRNDGGGGIQPVVGVVLKATDNAITIDVDGNHRTYQITAATKEINDNSNAAKSYDKAHSAAGELVGIIPNVEGGSEAQLIISNYGKM